MPQQVDPLNAPPGHRTVTVRVFTPEGREVVGRGLTKRERFAALVRAATLRLPHANTSRWDEPKPKGKP